MAFGGTCSFSPIQWQSRGVPEITLSVVAAIMPTSLLGTAGTTVEGREEGGRERERERQREREREMYSEEGRSSYQLQHMTAVLFSQLLPSLHA